MENSQIKNTWKVVGIISLSISSILIGVTVLLLIQNGNQQSKINSQKDVASQCDNESLSNKEGQENAEQNPNTNISDKPQADINGYLVIREWGLRVKLPEADKLEYTHSTGNTGVHYNTGGTPDSSVVITAKQSLISTESCVADVGAIIRVANIVDVQILHNLNGRIIGDFGYFGIGPQDGGICNDYETEIKTDIMQALKDPRNYEAL